MNELQYFDALAAEVIRAQDPRLQKLFEWCQNINNAIKACNGDADILRKHSAVVASAVLMEAIYIEETTEKIASKAIVTPYNHMDSEITKFSLRLMENEREIEIGVEITDCFGAVSTGTYHFAPITIPLREKI